MNLSPCRSLLPAALVSALAMMTPQFTPALAAAASGTNDVVQTSRSAAKAGDLAFRLTTPAELKALLGAPLKEHTEKERDRDFLVLDYPGVRAVFGHFGENSPLVLFQVEAEGSPLDIGRGGPLKLRSLADLAKLDAFWGVAGASLVKLDLSGQMARLNELPFSSQTQWPPADKLPQGFDPAKILEDGKSPGLGIARLHEQGIDGRGIHIAIIDQPLLREHVGYKDSIVEYTAIEVEGAPPQMHGPAVASIAVGKSCGTAPAACVHYYAVPTWKWWNEHCRPYAATLQRIVESNKTRALAQRIRVVSISLGAFSEWPDHDLWTNAVHHANQEGILVVTCDPADYSLSMLRRKVGQDPDNPTNYVSQFGFSFQPLLGVPAGNRTTAAYTGPTDYVFWRTGGMSWTVPYLAGLGALAFQVDPQLKPQDIRALWMQTATRTPAALVVNPPAFLEAVRKAKPVRGAASRRPGRARLVLRPASPLPIGT